MGRTQNPWHGADTTVAGAIPAPSAVVCELASLHLLFWLDRLDERLDDILVGIGNVRSDTRRSALGGLALGGHRCPPELDDVFIVCTYVSCQYLVDLNSH